MTKTKTKTKTVPAEQAILEALQVGPQATVAQLAVSAGLGRSTAGKLLAQLESAGKVRRIPGGRAGARRLPDHWSLASEQPAPAEADGDAPKAPAVVERLRPGQLDGLVLDYMREHIEGQPHGPSAVAKAIERSSGAVGNCLVRLARGKQVREISDHPRRYSLRT